MYYAGLSEPGMGGPPVQFIQPGGDILDSYSKRMSQKCYQFFINEKLKKKKISPIFHFDPVNDG